MARKISCYLTVLIATQLAFAADELAERQYVFDATKQAFLAGDFAGLESMTTDFRDDKLRTSSGVWKLDCFYEPFDTPVFLFGTHGQDSFDKIAARAPEWLAAYPKSKSANIVFAMAILNKGGVARGSGYANTVTPQGWSDLRLYAELARQHLEDVRETASDDPHWYATMMKVSAAEEWPGPSFRVLSAEALRREPAYGPTIDNIVKHNLPRWGGTPQSLEEAVNEIAAANGEADRDGAYARSYWYAAGYIKHEVFLQTLADWPRMKKGFARILEIYPGEWNLNAYARFACLAQVKQTTREALEQLGSAIIVEAWDDKAMPSWCREWSKS